jgi:hypothetical protein
MYEELGMIPARKKEGMTIEEKLEELKDRIRLANRVRMEDFTEMEKSTVQLSKEADELKQLLDR